jgi:hypothetical protein
LIMTGSISNAYVLCEYGDRGYDFAHALQTNPTLFIQSANQSATEWLSLAHDQTYGRIKTGTGAVCIGTSNPTYAVASGNLYAQYNLECGQKLYANQGVQLGIGWAVGYNTAVTGGYYGGVSQQTPDCPMLTTGTTANLIIIAEDADRTYDFAHALQTNPTLFIQSANQSATEWLSLAHNQTVGLVSAGTGIEIATGANGDFTVDTASTERFKLTGTTGIHHFPTTSSVSAYRNSNQNLTTSAYTDVVFDAEIYDVKSEFNTGTGVFTALEAGKYKCSWAVGSDSRTWAAGDMFQASLSKNNATTVTNQFMGNRWLCQYAITDTASSVGSATVTLAASETLRVKVYHTQGGTIKTAADGRYNYFTIQKVA